LERVDDEGRAAMMARVKIDNFTKKTRGIERCWGAAGLEKLASALGARHQADARRRLPPRSRDVINVVEPQREVNHALLVIDRAADQPSTLELPGVSRAIEQRRDGRVRGWPSLVVDLRAV
jgi:ribosomal protein L20A (L18A)